MLMIIMRELSSLFHWFIHDNTKRRHGVATFRASDGSLSSETKTLDIVAVPQSKLVVTKNELLLLRYCSYFLLWIVLFS